VFASSRRAGTFEFGSMIKRTIEAFVVTREMCPIRPAVENTGMFSRIPSAEPLLISTVHSELSTPLPITRAPVLGGSRLCFRARICLSWSS
jgi:hypothetical protein